MWASPLKGIDKLVALRLAHYASDTGERIFPSLSRLQRECGLARNTVKKAIDVLLEGGMLIEISPASASTHQPACYRMDLDLLSGQNAAPRSNGDLDPRSNGDLAPPRSNGDLGWVKRRPLIGQVEIKEDLLREVTYVSGLCMSGGAGDFGDTLEEWDIP